MTCRKGLEECQNQGRGIILGQGWQSPLYRPTDLRRKDGGTLIGPLYGTWEPDSASVHHQPFPDLSEDRHPKYPYVLLSESAQTCHVVTRLQESLPLRTIKLTIWVRSVDLSRAQMVGRAASRYPQRVSNRERTYPYRIWQPYRTTCVHSGRGPLNRSLYI